MTISVMPLYFLESNIDVLAEWKSCLNACATFTLDLKPEGLITLCVVSLVLLFFLTFFLCVFPRVNDTNILLFCWYQKHAENSRKTRENCPTQEKHKKIFLYYTIHWLKMRAIFLAFFAHKPYQNANPTHSLIWT